MYLYALDRDDLIRVIQFLAERISSETAANEWVELPEDIIKYAIEQATKD